MKMTILALTAFVLAVAPLAPAQEETETPAPAPEATAPEQSESPATDPSVSVTTEKSEPTPPEKSSSPAAREEQPATWTNKSLFAREEQLRCCADQKPAADCCSHAGKEIDSGSDLERDRE